MDRHALEQVKLRFYITTVFRIPCKHIFASKIPTFLNIPQEFEFYENFNIMKTLITYWILKEISIFSKPECNVLLSFRLV